MTVKSDSTPFTQLVGLSTPIVQGPFGSGFSTPILTSTVSNSGGLGSFGAHHLSREDIAKTISNIRALTREPFAVNLWVSNSDREIATLSSDHYAEVAEFYAPYLRELGLSPPPFPAKFSESFADQIEAIYECKPTVFSCVFGIPDAHVMKELRQRKIITLGAATTPQEAKVVQDAGFDAVVLSGFEAGGHRPSFLRTSEDSLYGLHTLVSATRKDLRIPLIAAGGLADLSSLRAVAVLGADAFQLGSAFLACKESGASEFHRKALLDRNQTPTLLTRAYTGRLARFIENEFTEMSRKRALPVLPYPAQNYLLAELKKVSALAVRTDLSPLYAGQGATHLLHDSAHALMQSLTHEPIHPTPERKTP